MLNIPEKMVLGTAQLGMNYGITNASGKPSRKEVFEILDLAWEMGIRRFDTAPDYGSEIILGEFILANGLQNKAIVLTKIPSLKGNSDWKKVIKTSIKSSLENIICPIKVLFFHDPKDSELIINDPQFFESLLLEYPISTLGISVYEPKEVERLSDCALELAFQFPFNVLDRRFEKVHMPHGKRYARSIFLQGLLVSRTSLRENAPLPLRIIQKNYHSVLEKLDFNPVSLAASYVADAESVDYFLCGAETKEQLSLILTANYCNYKDHLALDQLISISDDKWLDPRIWV